jgi:hypothetical protein
MNVQRLWARDATGCMLTLCVHLSSPLLVAHDMVYDDWPIKYMSALVPFYS